DLATNFADVLAGDEPGEVNDAEIGRLEANDVLPDRLLVYFSHDIHCLLAASVAQVPPVGKRKKCAPDAMCGSMLYLVPWPWLRVHRTDPSLRRGVVRARRRGFSRDGLQPISLPT